TVPTAPPVEDPCKRKLGCLDWGSYRQRILVPFIKQMQENKALSQFSDDELPDSIFSKEGFKAFYESQTLPDDSQVIGAESAAIQSLKLLTACLSQIRSVRVEALRNVGADWTDLVALPGCFVLLIYTSTDTDQDILEEEASPVRGRKSATCHASNVEGPRHPGGFSPSPSECRHQHA
nr:hypothetical protein [Dehalococcoidia bacterium]